VESNKSIMGLVSNKNMLKITNHPNASEKRIHPRKPGLSGSYSEPISLHASLKKMEVVVPADGALPVSQLAAL
jgi:hypothetical protein